MIKDVSKLCTYQAEHASKIGQLSAFSDMQAVSFSFFAPEGI